MSRTETRRRQIERWRSEVPPVPWRVIGERLGCSAQYAHRIFTGGGHREPLVRPKLWHCVKCGRGWRSWNRQRPERCRHCGTYDWDMAAGKRKGAA